MSALSLRHATRKARVFATLSMTAAVPAHLHGGGVAKINM